LPLLLLVAMAFRRSWLFVLALVLLPTLSRPAQAGSWTDLWRRPDQQAAAALRRGDARQAQAVARDPAWRGAAAYRAGDYATAAKALQQAPGATAAYNRGNALARAGQFEAAISAFDRALQLDPNLADAKANRQAVQDWLRKHQAAARQSPPDQKSRGDQPPKPGSPGKSGGQSQQKPSAAGATADQSQGDPGGSGQSSDDQGQSGKDKPPSSASAPSPSNADAEGKPAQAPSAAPPPSARTGTDGTGPEPPAPTPQQQATRHAQAAQAQRALSEQMDKALQAKSGQATEPVHDLGAAATNDAQSRLPADVQRALRHVPDDPGALLRRKFELEYQQRHGRIPDVEDQP